MRVTTSCCAIKKKRKMPNCYKCTDEINDENVSTEHIIPNAVGGRLKSKELLCNICNSDLEMKQIYI